MVVFENVVTGYQSAGGFLPAPAFDLPSNAPPERDIFALLWPVTGPYAFVYGQDLLLFSLSRSSASIGTLDSNGIPIMPGDILLGPAGPSPTSLVPPTIVMAAEVLGLRTDRVAPFDLALMDDLDALEITQ